MDNIYASFHIESVCSPKVIVKNYFYSNIYYNIWNYNSECMCYNEKIQVAQCRSLIMSHPENKLLSFSHGKSLSYETFTQMYNINDVYINEYIDGTLIHLFFDYKLNTWVMATKSSIGGNYFLYNKNYSTKSSKTVFTMFLEALSTNDPNLSNNVLINNLPKNYCYNFVLLHPENPIVFPINQPKLYLIAVFDICNTTNKAVNIPPHIFENFDCFKNSTILFSQKANYQSYDELKQNQFELFNKNKEICGYHAIHLPSGNRCIFKNPVYIDLLRFKTINPRNFFLYLCLRRNNSIKDFLKQFPEFKKRFNLFNDHFKQYIENLHCAYLAKYVFKNCNTIDYKYQNYIESIHREIYIKSINNRQKEKVTIKKVHNYVMSKCPGEILYILFSEKRNLYKIT